MTGWRHAPSDLVRSVFRTATVRALCATTAGVALVSGCGVVPGGPGHGKDTVTVMTWAPVGTSSTNMPGTPAMAKAFAGWVNATGGLGGHKLRVLTCNEHNTPGGAATCAREAVKADVDAVVGSYSQYGQQFIAPLEAAAIPYLGGFGISDEEFSSFVSYPVNGGQAALLAGNGRQLAHSCERTALVRPDTIGGDDFPDLLDSGLAQGHRRPTADIRAPENATDYTKQAEEAREHVAGAEGIGCVAAHLKDRTETFFDSYRRLPENPGAPAGGDIRISSVVGSVDQPLIDRTGGKGGPFEGAYITGWYPESGDPAWQPMRKVIDTYAFADNDIDPASPGVQTTWIAYTALKQIIESVNDDEITAGKITDTLDRGVTVNTGGLTPPLRWRYEDMLGAPGFPRIVNRDVTFQVVRGGRLVAQTKGFTDVGATLGNSATKS
ncbi:ABC transporter substrate-binding protein [Streptomyces sp. NPDC088725]|uniref:ABC transporter substrate-binding protein n=1 Tax=Streptomyces sp. NPDC088725 TaxID=3365873 RepID=UPI003803EE4F